HIVSDVEQLNRRTTDDRSVFEFKKRFLDRFVLKAAPTRDDLASMNVTDIEFRYRQMVAEILTRGELADDPERELAEVALRLLDREAAAKASTNADESARCRDQQEDVIAWARVLVYHPELKLRRQRFASFAHPEKLDFDNLVPREFTDPKLPTLFE